MSCGSIEAHWIDHKPIYIAFKLPNLFFQLILPYIKYKILLKNKTYLKIKHISKFQVLQKNKFT